MAVSRMQGVRSMAPMNPYVEEKENFRLFTMQLWFYKANSV